MSHKRFKLLLCLVSPSRHFCFQELKFFLVFLQQAFPLLPTRRRVSIVSASISHQCHLVESSRCTIAEVSSVVGLAQPFPQPVASDTESYKHQNAYINQE